MENETQQDVLCAQLDTVDESLQYLIFIIVAVLLSFWSVVIQRKQLCCTIAGDTECAANAPPVYPIKIGASALVIGSLGFFFCLALKACKTAAEGDDCVAQHSASMNVWASLLVLAAALIRLYDLNYVERCQRALLESDDLPE